MIKFFKKSLSLSIDFIEYSCLFVAICVGCFAFSTSLYYNLKPNYYLLCFTTFSTALLYFLHRWIKCHFSNAKHVQNPHIRWIKQNPLLALLLLFSYTCISLYCFYKLHFHLQLNLIIIGIPSLLYTLSNFSFVPKSIKIRNHPFAKIFIITLSVNLLCTLIPLLEAHINPLNISYITYFLFRQVFLIAITLPFDHRDKLIDQLDKIKTFANAMALKKLHALFIALFLAYYFLLFLLWSDLKLNHLITFCLAIFGLLLYLFCKNPNPNRRILLLMEASMCLFALLA